MTDIRTIVIDHGSGTISAGFAGEKTPSSVFPSIVGRPLFVTALLGGDERDLYIGDESMENSPILSHRYQVKHRIVTYWEDIEKLEIYIL